MAMMSMFSAFDALCLESYFGLNTRFLVGPTRAGQEERTKAQGSGEVKKPSPSGDGGSSRRPPQQEKRRMRPRFAPELDGVHCFETILPY